MTDFSCFKTSPPQLQQVFPRQRLHDRLDCCLERPLVWVSGPGGSGKRTLVAHYLHLRRLPAIWYRLDHHDNDGTMLFRCMENLLSPSDPSPLPPPLPQERMPDTGWVRSWFRAFFDTISPDTVLVFADVHTVTDNDGWCSVLACCLEELPATGHVIVISREPAPPLLTGVSRCELMHTLSWDDIKVTPEEAMGIAELVQEEPDEQTVRQFHAQTNGWVAGLLLCLRHGGAAPGLLLGRSEEAEPPDRDSRLTIFTLGRFELFQAGQAVAFNGKVPKKPLELLKILLSNGGQGVSTSALIEWLWPEARGDAAANSLTTTIQRLRHLLGCDKIVRVQQGEVGLAPHLVRVDAWEFSSLLAQAQEARCLGDDPQAEHLTNQAATLYRGHFLPTDHDKPWSIACRDRLRSKFHRHVGGLCHRLAEQGDTDAAVACYQERLEVDHLAEEFYQQLMLCYHQTGLHAEAAVTYQSCRKALAIHLGIAPSPRTEEIYRMIQDAASR